MRRREFCSAIGAAAAAGSTLSLAQDKEEAGVPLRVGIIGHTGRGNYGHGLDTAWLNIPGAEIVGVADPDDAGRAKALKRLGVSEDVAFTGYHRMLQALKPEFVSICPRHADQHKDMLIAAMRNGAKGIYVEKPFVRTPQEVDEVWAVQRETGTKIAVAHRNRYHPVIQVIHNVIKEGKIGKVLEIRGRGKGDRRGGGEDLWVLGTHVMDLIHRMSGRPLLCSAVMKQDGRLVVAKDVVDGPEGLGPLAGNEVHARFSTESGVIATFDSVADDGTEGAGFGLQMIGSEGIIDVSCDKDPLAYYVPGNPFKPSKEPRPWIPITSGGIGVEEPNPELIKAVQNHQVALEDLIAAVNENRFPLCSLRDAGITVEMVCAIFASHQKNSEMVGFPLKERGNALENL